MIDGPDDHAASSSEPPWRRVEPLPPSLLTDLSREVRRFTHDANNALTAAFAATDLASAATNDTKQKQRLARAARQLFALQTLTRSVQTIAWRDEDVELEPSWVKADIDSLATRTGQTLDGDWDRCAAELITCLSAEVARHLLRGALQLSGSKRGHISATAADAGPSTTVTVDWRRRGDDWQLEIQCRGPEQLHGRPQLPSGHLGLFLPATAALLARRGASLWSWIATDSIRLLVSSDGQNSPLS